jgi:acyl-CoA reductase-like NAD-dependent aldehyde dehydrogenase
MGCIQRARTQGATVHLGGERYGTQGYWVQPTIITNTRPEMDIVKEEMFGPVAIIIKFVDEDEVMKLANDSMYGLTASFFTKDLKRGVQVANKLQAGTVWVNCVNMFHPGVPYGGFKQSGIGRECGQYALDTCVVSSMPFIRCAARTWRNADPGLLPATPTSNPSTSTRVNVPVRLPEGARLIDWRIFILSKKAYRCTQ